MAGRPTWTAGLARSSGRQVDGDGRVEVNLMAAALLLVSESVLATARSDFAEVAVINGTVSTRITTAASVSSLAEVDGCDMSGCAAELLDGAAELLEGAVLFCSMDGAIP